MAAIKAKHEEKQAAPAKKAEEKPPEVDDKTRIRATISMISEMTLSETKIDWKNAFPYHTRKEKVGFIMRSLGSSDEEISTAVTNLACRLAGYNKYNDQEKEALGVLANSYLNSEDRMKAGIGLQLLGALMEDRSLLLDAALGFLDDKRESVRNAAVGIVMKEGGPNVVRDLLPKIANETKSVKITAVKSLTFAIDEEYALLGKLFRDPDSTVQYVAFEKCPVENVPDHIAPKLAADLLAAAAAELEPSQKIDAMKKFGSLFYHGNAIPDELILKAMEYVESSMPKKGWDPMALGLRQFGFGVSCISIARISRPDLEIPAKLVKEMEKKLGDWTYFNFASGEFEEITQGGEKTSKAERFMNYLAHGWGKWPDKERDAKLKEFEEVVARERQEMQFDLGIMQVLAKSLKKANEETGVKAQLFGAPEGIADMPDIPISPTNAQLREEIAEYFEKWKKRQKNIPTV